MPLHDGLPQSLPDHRLLPEPCGKEDRKKFIIDTRRENPSMKAREIAQRAKCTADHVRKILKAHQAPAIQHVKTIKFQAYLASNRAQTD